MKTKIIILFLFNCILLGCNRKESVDTNGSSTASVFTKSFNDSENIKKLYKNISEKGDTIAYNNLEKIYFLSGHRLDFLYVSIEMSNKYKYHRAYYDTFTCLYRLNNDDDDSGKWVFDKSTDIETLTYALENLKKASFLGNKQARQIIELYNMQNMYVEQLR